MTKPTEVPVTIDDIARAVGVHPGTVSRALRGISGKVSKDKRAEIEKVARDLGYQPNTIAASLRTKRTNIAAIVVPDLSNPLFGPIVQGLEQELRKHRMSESLRGSIQAVSQGQWLAGTSLGLTRTQTLRYVVGPQALRAAVPSLSNSLISLIKDTSLVSVIAVTELMLATKELISTTFQPFPLYLAAAGVYWVLSSSFEQVQRWMEKRFAFPR